METRKQWRRETRRRENNGDEKTMRRERNDERETRKQWRQERSGDDKIMDMRKHSMETRKQRRRGNTGDKKRRDDARAKEFEKCHAFDISG